MEPRKMMKQMIAFYKTSFDNSFAAMLMMQEQMERLTKLSLAQTTGLPEGWQKALDDWSEAYKKGCADFKKAIGDNFKQAETFFSEADKPEKAEKVKPA